MSAAATKYLTWTADKNRGPIQAAYEGVAVTGALRVVNGADATEVAAEILTAAKKPVLVAQRGSAVLRNTATFMPKRGCTDADVAAVIALADALDSR